MTDLIERLRNYTKSFPELADVAEAADEIERLLAVVAAAKMYVWILDHGKTAHAMNCYLQALEKAVAQYDKEKHRE